jgi:hypothetical protein
VDSFCPSVTVSTLMPGIARLGSSFFPLQNAVDEEECSPQFLLKNVAGCAKQNRGFLGCVGRGNPGPTRQCDCIDVNDEMRACLGRCLPAVINSLCRLRWSPRMFQPQNWICLDFKSTRNTQLP